MRQLLSLLTVIVVMSCGQGIDPKAKELFDQASPEVSSDRGIELLQQAVDIDPDYYQAWNHLGLFYARNGQYKEAIGSFKHSLEIKPDHHLAWINLGNNYFKTDSFDNAAKSYENVVRLEPDFVEGYYRLGEIYKELDNADKAVKNYKRAIAYDSSYYHQLVYRAEEGLRESTLKQEKISEVIAEYELILMINPNDLLALHDLSGAYMMQNKKLQAVACLETAVGISPNYPLLRYSLALAYTYTQKYPEAIEQYERLIEIDPTFSEWRMYAQVYLSMNDTQGAQQLYERAVEKGYTGPKW